MTRLHCQEKHRPDAVGRALGGIEARAAEEPGGVGLTCGNDPVGLVERIRAGDLGNIVCLTAQRPPPLVARHVEPGGAEVCVVFYEIIDGCVHVS